MKPSNDAVQENDTESVISVEPKEQHETKEVNTNYFYYVRLIHDFFNEAIAKHDNSLLFLKLSHCKI